MSSNRPPLAEHPRVYSKYLDLIGDTPLVRLSHAESPGSAAIWGKLESANPGGSIKDRICLAMIEAAEENGALKPGGVVIEPTSGNTGIGLALVCRSKGYRCILTMPESMSLERRQLLLALGAELVLTPEETQMDGALARAQELATEHPGAFLPHQFENKSNPKVHAETTALEILKSMSDLSLDAFVAGIGTGGTLSGVGSVLRERSPECQIVGVEPESCATISRGERGPTKIQGWAAGFIPANFDPAIPHQIRTVSDIAAFEAMRKLATKAGILAGISSGGALVIAQELAAELGEGKNVVVILPDTGERYFSLGTFFEESAAE